VRPYIVADSDDAELFNFLEPLIYSRGRRL
jgi:hypothetical protein